MFDLNKIRADFPVLHQERNGRPPVYLDSACMSLKPQPVIEALLDYYTKFSACAERSDHWFASETDQRIRAARKTIANYLRAQPEEVVFMHNTTEGINLLANWVREQKHGVVVISDKEHNSNFLPWKVLAENTSIQLKIVPTDTDHHINIQRLKETLAKYAAHPGVKLVSTFYTSNLDGSTNPVEKITAAAYEYGFYTHFDSAQALPHKNINVHELNADFITFSGHKMLGPTGTGVLWGKSELLEKLPPFIVGGGTPFDATYEQVTFQEPPMRFEGGLQNYAGIIGFGAAVTYLDTYIDKVADHEHALNTYTTQQLLKLSDRINIIGPPEAEKRASILSFVIEGMDHRQVAYLLNDQANVMVRAGRHCVHGYCNRHNIPGTIRVSFYLYNTIAECDIFLDVMGKIVKL